MFPALLDITGRASVVLFSPEEAALCINSGDAYNIETSVLQDSYSILGNFLKTILLNINTFNYITHSHSCILFYSLS